MSYFKSGRKCNEKEFDEALAKLNRIQSLKNILDVKRDKTFNELKMFLGQYDGVRIMLDSEVELVICVNNKWYINDKLYGVENEELFEKYMNFILSNL
mgnify:FL=1